MPVSAEPSNIMTWLPIAYGVSGFLFSVFSLGFLFPALATPTRFKKLADADVLEKISAEDIESSQLPAPVKKYLKTASKNPSGALPMVKSVTTWSSGRAGIGFFTKRVAIKSFFKPGGDFESEMLPTWFQKKMRGVWKFAIAGKSMVRYVSKRESGKQTEPNTAIAKWIEALFAPAALATDRTIRWDAVDADTARLTVPAGDSNVSITVRFDPATGMPRELEPDTASGAKNLAGPWKTVIFAWQTVSSAAGTTASTISKTGLEFLIPETVEYHARPADNAPWKRFARFHVGGAAYNVDIDPKLAKSAESI